MKLKNWAGAVAVGSVMMMASPASAKIYNFSGILDVTGLFSPNPSWNFSLGQKFTGTLNYDPAAIKSQSTWIYPDVQYSTYFSPVVSLDFKISGNSVNYHHSVPLTTPQGYDITYAQINLSNQPYYTNGWGIVASNYPNSIVTAPVPQSSMIGSFYPHSVFVGFAQYVQSGNLVNSMNPDLDLVSLFHAINPADPYGADFSVRFSDPAHWGPGAEVIDGYISGKITSFALVDSGAVPEPATWALMILGFGGIGAALRRREMRPSQLEG